MKLTKNEFRALQQEWYRKLSEDGFKDIEKLKGDEFVLAQTSSHCFQGPDIDPFTRYIKTEYFRILSQIAQEALYKNDIDRHVLLRYSEGAKIHIIVKELIIMGTPRGRASIRFIIRRYEVRWGLKNYNVRQLNRKIK